MTAPVTTTIEALQGANRPGLMFKGLGGVIFTADMAVDIPAAFTDGATANLIQLAPTDWTQLGLITKGEGVTFPREIATEDTESWGYNEPPRTDVVTDITSATFTLQQTSRAVLEMYDFVDLSAVTPDATTGEVAYNKPLVSAVRYRRMIFLAYDGTGTDRRYKIKVMPRAQVTAVEDEAWQQGTATQYPMTVRATVDPALGYAVRNVLAGPGQLARNTDAGFASA